MIRTGKHRMADLPAKLLAGEYFVQALNLKANSCATLCLCTDHFLQQKRNLEFSQLLTTLKPLTERPNLIRGLLQK